MPMAKKILVPVFPSEWFYDAVIRAADVVNHEGGLITFAFCRVRPPEDVYAEDPDGRPDELDISINAGDFDARDLEQWREKQIAGLDEALGYIAAHDGVWFATGEEIVRAWLNSGATF
jgi:hypothetical protein